MAAGRAEGRRLTQKGRAVERRGPGVENCQTALVTLPDLRQRVQM